MISTARQFLKEIKYAPIEKMILSFVLKSRQTDVIRNYHKWKISLKPQVNEQIQDVLAAHPDVRAQIVFPPSLNWDQQLFQRPQQLARALANRGAVVFYTQIQPLENGLSIQPIANRLYLCSLPLEQFSILEQYFAYVLTWNRKYLLKLNQAHILYDYLDDIMAFDGNKAQLTLDHLALLQNADLVTTTAKNLFENARMIRSDALYVPNGADFHHFHGNREPLLLPADLDVVKAKGKPVIGFYGAFASWFDYELMRELALNRPDLSLVLIGPKHGSYLDESGLLSQPNVYYLGTKPYGDLPLYLNCFDVAILPFKVNQITQSTSPIKLFEYFAGGKPVVSTPMMEVMQYDGALIAENAGTFADKIDWALSLRVDSEFIDQLYGIAQENTWEIRAEQILRAMEQILQKSQNTKTGIVE